MRVLIIDDYEPLSFLLVAMCQKVGNAVDVVFSLQAALEKLDELPPSDLVFLDLTLIDTSPESTIRAIPLLKAKTRKLVIMTGNPKESLIFSAMNAGADDYVSKNNADFPEVIESYMKDIHYQRMVIPTPI